MAPKNKFTKEELVAAALQVVRTKGIEGLTAKTMADALGTSTQPIFTAFGSMDSVRQEVCAAAVRVYDRYTNAGLQEKIPFFGVGMQENRCAVSFDDVFGELGPTARTCIRLIRETYGLREAEAQLLFENMWIYTFGVGALCATRVCRFSEEKLGQMLSVEFQAMMLLVKSKAADVPDPHAGSENRISLSARR